MQPLRKARVPHRFPLHGRSVRGRGVSSHAGIREALEHHARLFRVDEFFPRRGAFEGKGGRAAYHPIPTRLFYQDTNWPARPRTSWRLGRSMAKWRPPVDPSLRRSWLVPVGMAEVRGSLQVNQLTLQPKGKFRWS